MNAAPIMIMAGGTGGHIFPGLAVAEILRARDERVVWLGTTRGLEAELVPERGIDIEWISIAGVRGRGWLAWLAAPFRIAWSVWQALSVILRRRPGAVLGLGGFVSAPGGIAAWITRKPLIIHEQNAVAGTANRLLARLATRVFEAFPGSFGSRVDAVEIGNPVRDEILANGNSGPRGGTPDRPVRLLVLGGSRGALILNRIVPEALAALPAESRPIVRHQAGQSLGEAEAAYRETGVAVELSSFIDDMAAAYSWADLVVARAGALTLAEIAAAGLGAILIPFPYAVDDHQARNAEFFAAAGGAIVLPQADLDASRLRFELERVIGNRAVLAEMGRMSHALMRPGAAERLADACVELAGARR